MLDGAEMEDELRDNLAKSVAFLELWDVYGALLTERQRLVTDLFFNCDLSLSEIAEQTGVSRQSVSDCLHKVKRQLGGYEEKLGFVRAMRREREARAALSARLKDRIERMKGEHPELKSELEALESALQEE